MKYASSSVWSKLISLSWQVCYIFLLDFYDIRFSTYNVFIHYFIIYNNTWLCMCFCPKTNECIKCTVVFNNNARKVWINYNIITVWYIQIYWFATPNVWVDDSTSTLFINIKNNPYLFPFWQHKFHNYLFYFYKILHH